MSATLEVEQKIKVTGVRIPDDLLKALKKHGVDVGLSLSELVTEIVLANIPDGARQYLQTS